MKLLQVTKAVIRHLAFHDGKRVDGRALNELRPITCKVKCDNGKICFSYKEIPTQGWTSRAFARIKSFPEGSDPGKETSPQLKIHFICLQYHDMKLFFLIIKLPGSLHGSPGQSSCCTEVGCHVCADRRTEGEEFHAAL